MFSSSVNLVASLLVSLGCLLPVVHCQYLNTFYQIMDNYALEWKPQRSGAAGVNVSVILHSLDVNVVGQSLIITCELIQEWHDHHVQFQPPQLTSARENDLGLFDTRLSMTKEKLWIPDIVPAAPVNIDYPSHGEFMRFNGIGYITWTQLIIYEAPCSFNLSPYPIGFLMCEIKYHSSGYGIEELNPIWKNSMALDWDRVALPPGYMIYDVQYEESSVAHIIRTRKQLVAKIYFRYEYGHHVKHTVIPMSAAVATAYLGFFINARNMAARMSIVGLSFVMAAVFHEGTYAPAPKVPYTMALEVFTGTCMTFIWLVGVESVLVDGIIGVLNRRQMQDGSHRLELPDGNDRDSSKAVLASMWLDRCFRIIYPAGFIIFNAIFWVTYSSSAYNMVQ